MQFQWFRVAAVLLVALAVSACTPLAQVKQQRLADLPLEQRAYVIGRYGVDCWYPSTKKCNQAFNSITTFFSHPGAEEGAIPGVLTAVTGSIFGENTTWDIVDMDRREQWVFFCEVVAAGTHEFTGMRYWDFAGGGSGYYIPREGTLGPRFEAPAGQVTYIGWVKASTGTGRNLLGMKKPAPDALELGEGVPEDHALALERCPVEAHGLEVRSLRVDPASAGTPLVRPLR